MKICPKCNASIIDTAKFCSKCGVNIKKFEEEQMHDSFCPECGAPLSGGDFCTECGFRVSGGTPEDEWANASTPTGRRASYSQNEEVMGLFTCVKQAGDTYILTGLTDKTAFQYAVPQGVVAIADCAFEGCNAIKITLPEGLLKVGASAFKACRNLTVINIPESLMIVGDEAFADCEMLDITLPSSVLRVGKDVTRNTIGEIKAAARKAEFAKWCKGGTVTFGSYWQNKSGTKTPIEWLVLEKEAKKVLIISKYCLDNVPYNEEKVDVTWETCTLRKWLNGDFLNDAFTGEEQKRIANTANDKLSLLSADEANKYFSSDKLRICSPTMYAQDNRAFFNTAKRSGLWWLRSSGNNVCKAACVNSYGEVYTDGLDVNYPGICVRPALWVNLEF